ncbi:MAG: lipid-binding SYLF domain-containing protein [Nitrospirota bacterium]|nr:lipid-binding SYLF domain-containing protein [Nitrospirota bacterium]
MKKLKRFCLAIICLGVITALTSCVGWDPNKEQKEEEQVKITIARFLDKDPGLNKFFDQAYGYVVFPNVGKGAYIVGGGYGKGIVYEQGNSIGYATIMEASVGLQIGGQGFSEIIFFKDKYTLDYFKQGNFEFSAQASAVAVNLGVAANSDYHEGVAVFTLPKGGLMAEASVGGQKFTFEPK